MKVDRISSVCSALKRKIGESGVVRAYNVYKYNKGSLYDGGLCEIVTDCFQGMSFRRAFLKIINKTHK